MTNEQNDPLIRISNVNKFFGDFQALKNINLIVYKGERIVICGPSGSGKSTLIRCMNRLESHNDGQIVIEGNELTDDIRDINAVRREVGMVFQSFNLFPHMTVLKNLIIAQRLVRKTSKKDAIEIAMNLLERVKIPEQANKYPIQLSGGQQQRVAIARALAAQPKILFADEPTGSLDEKNSKIVLDMLLNINRKYNTSLVVITHSIAIASKLEVCLELKSRKISKK